MYNPFKPAEPVARKLKVLLYGPAGSGKTTAALTFPHAAIIDTEGGSDLYAGREGFAPFDILRAKTLSELESAIAFIKTGDHAYETLIIDSVTVLYEVAREALAAKKGGDMSYREWGKLNTRMEALYNTLTDLPVHVVMIAREATEYEGTGDSLKKVGSKPDADKSLVYNMDIVVRMQRDRKGRVEKSRGAEIIAENSTLDRVTWSSFAPLADTFSTGATVSHATKSEAIDAEVDSLTDRDVAADFVLYWRGQGLTDSDILSALGIKRISQYPAGRKAANEQVQSWLNTRLNGKAAAS